MQVGSFVAGDVSQLTSRVTVGGVDRAHKSWTVSRDLVGDMPDQVVAGSGIKQATGSIVWAEGGDVTDGAVNPWNASAGWLPKQGEIVAIYVSDGVTEWPQFVGVIDENSGDVGDLPSSTIVDYIDYLNRAVSQPTVFFLHPPKSEGGEYMGVGMGAPYAVDRTLRACGLYATPRMEPGCVVSVPGQMSMWPELGTVTAATDYAGSPAAGGAGYKRASWGVAQSDFNATYTPNSTFPASTSPVQFTARVDAAHADAFSFTAYYDSTQVQLFVDAARVATGRLNGAVIVSLALEAGSTIVSLLVKAGAWTLKTSGGATATANAAVPAGSNLASVRAVGTQGASVAGLQVSSPAAGSEFQALGHVDYYYQDMGAFGGRMSALPSYVNRKASELLEDICKSSLAAMWFNERGQLRIIGSDVLRAQAPVQTVTTLDDIYSLSWSDSRLGVRSKVRVKYRFPGMNKSRYSNITLWQGSSETMESNEEKVLIAEAPTDEDWAEIDHFGVSNAGGLTAFNQGRGTWVGGYLEASDGTWTADTGYGSWELSTIDDRTRKFRVTTSTLPAGKSYVLATPDDAVNYFLRFRGMSYPVLRGRGKVKWTDSTVTAATTGPAGFPELEHDAGVWGATSVNTTVQDAIAAFIAGQVSTPSPTITGMRVAFDPRRQLGDVITIDSPDLMGVKITALIVGVRNAAGESFAQTLNVRIISAATTYTTYGQFEQAHPDTLTYEQWRALFPDTATYDTFNDDPLRGATP